MAHRRARSMDPADTNDAYADRSERFAARRLLSEVARSFEEPRPLPALPGRQPCSGCRDLQEELSRERSDVVQELVARVEARAVAGGIARMEERELALARAKRELDLARVTAVEDDARREKRWSERANRALDDRARELERAYERRGQALERAYERRGQELERAYERRGQALELAAQARAGAPARPAPRAQRASSSRSRSPREPSEPREPGQPRALSEPDEPGPRRPLFFKKKRAIRKAKKAALKTVKKTVKKEARAAEVRERAEGEKVAEARAAEVREPAEGEEAQAPPPKKAPAEEDHPQKTPTKWTNQFSIKGGKVYTKATKDRAEQEEWSKVVVQARVLGLTTAQWQ